MHRRLVAVGLLVAALALPAPALATHMSSYRYTPTEHDDQGRVDEPDFATTAVLGRLVSNCIVSPTLAPGCVPDPQLPSPGSQAAVLAPGCTDDSGRRPSGLCGLFTIGVGNGNVGDIFPAQIAGVQGKTGSGAPGRFTPTKTTTIRFLDAQVAYQLVPPAGGVTYLDYNRKLADAGLAAAMRALDPSLGSPFITAGGTALWAWHGLWTDKNGNGVVDHMDSEDCSVTTCGPTGGVLPSNEFLWVGKCIQFNGQSAPTGQRYCLKEPGLQMPAWIFPGSHHAYCGFAVTPLALECGFAPADFPGRQAFNFALGAFGSGADLDAFDDQFTGDPLFGPQEVLRVDHLMADRTGEAQMTGRHWVVGNGWALFFYDQSLAVSTTTVVGTTTAAPDEALPTLYDLGKLTSADVDSYRTWSPALEQLLQASLKPLARSQWVMARDAAFAAGDVGPGYQGTSLTYDQCDDNLGKDFCLGTNTGPSLGALDDQTFDPGWAREPNSAQDSYPGAVRGACPDPDSTFKGWCNSYAGHAAGWHAWMDVQEAPAVYTNLAWRTPIGNCITCVTGPPSLLPGLPAGYVRPPGSHERVLQPGSHVFGGVVGAWQDRTQAHDETTIDLLATVQNLGLVFKRFTYTVGPDGWVGDVVNNTGVERASGFGPEACTIQGSSAEREYAECHPYLDGNIDGSIFADPASGAPQRYDEDGADGEWQFARPGENGANQWVLRLRPAGGCWAFPVFVWRAFDTWTIGDLGVIQDFTGKCQAIEMPLGLGPGTGVEALRTRDVLFLPTGNMGQAVTSEVAGVVVAEHASRGINLREFVRDVDEYAPYGG